ncbi:hypothetical protein ADIAG_03997 [Paeniglutamicibacter gangotriensis Lz1y]|uniref:Uncharacterized protein n=1 Tax=Paeniglutamicibacter gangotriensis Lz1y TaxID=1276920 RepID=M7MNR2_9MICC|nr:hypothetical protein ADIAG_03997 [Paeniglutamicibacter gangotriensis Lz1y]
MRWPPLSASASGPRNTTNAEEVAKQATRNSQSFGIADGIVLGLILLLTYYYRGYVAGCMARLGGFKQGAAAWLWGIVIVAILANLGGVPQIPVEGSLPTTSGLIGCPSPVLVPCLGRSLAARQGRASIARKDSSERGAPSVFGMHGSRRTPGVGSVASDWISLSCEFHVLRSRLRTDQTRHGSTAGGHEKSGSRKACFRKPPGPDHGQAPATSQCLRGRESVPVSVSGVISSRLISSLTVSCSVTVSVSSRTRSTGTVSFSTTGCSA